MNDFEERLRARMQDLRRSIEPPAGLWARVEHHASQRRWVPAAMGAVAAAVLLFVAIAGVSRGGGSNRVVASGPAVSNTTTTTTPASVGIEAPPTSQAPDTTPRTSTTIASKRTTTTMPPAASTTTTAAPIPQCTASDLAYVIATDRQSYPPTTTVHFTLTEQNMSGSPCSVPTGGCPQTAVQVFAADGTKVWDNRLPPGAYACPIMTDVTLQPGQAQTTTADWDQRNCPTPAIDESSCSGTQVPPGTYTARGLWNAGGASYIERASTGFAIT